MPEKPENAPNGGIVSAILPHPPRRESKPKENAISSGSQHEIWILKENQPVQISVTTGVTDGVNTEIVDGEIEPGIPVIVDTISKGTSR